MASFSIQQLAVADLFIILGLQINKMENKVTVQIGTENREFDLSEIDERQRWLIKTTLESERAELLLSLYTEVSTAEMNEILKKILWTNKQLSIVEEIKCANGQ